MSAITRQFEYHAHTVDSRSEIVFFEKMIRSKHIRSSNIQFIVINAAQNYDRCIYEYTHSSLVNNNNMCDNERRRLAIYLSSNVFRFIIRIFIIPITATLHLACTYNLYTLFFVLMDFVKDGSSPIADTVS